MSVAWQSPQPSLESPAWQQQLRLRMYILMPTVYLLPPTLRLGTGPM